MSPTFLEVVQKSGLIEPPRLEAHLRQLGPAVPADPKQLAGLLVRDGLLTNFQASLLIQGKYRGFILRGKYKLLDLLGVGGMGRVFLCEHVLLRRLVAVKVLPEDRAKDRSAVDRFLREARAVAVLDHPNIVRVYDIEIDDKFPLMIMEYVDGSNLHKLVQKLGPLTVDQACHYIRQAALGLQHAHEAGLVHRDIKPANLLVDRLGVVKLLDLGLARFFHDKNDHLTADFDDKTVLGTAEYLAPEQAMNSKDVDIRADLYSLGATFAFLLTGHALFGEATAAQNLVWHQMREPPSVREDRPDVPPELEAILLQLLAKEPNQRYQTPAELAEALVPWTQTPIAPPPSTVMPRHCPLVASVSTLRTAAHASSTAIATASATAPLAPPPASTNAPTRPLPTAPAPVARRPRRRPLVAALAVGLVGVVAVGLAVAGGLLMYPADRTPDTSPKPVPTLPGGVLAAEEFQDPARAKTHDHRVCTVRFTVKGAGWPTNRGILYLNSNPNYRLEGTVTAVIGADLLEKLDLPDAKSHDIQDVGDYFKNKTVEVTGKVELLRGPTRPEIIVTAPDHIRVVE